MVSPVHALRWEMLRDSPQSLPRVAQRPAVTLWASVSDLSLFCAHLALVPREPSSSFNRDTSFPCSTALASWWGGGGGGGGGGGEGEGEGEGRGKGGGERRKGAHISYARHRVPLQDSWSVCGTVHYVMCFLHDAACSSNVEGFNFSEMRVNSKLLQQGHNDSLVTTTSYNSSGGSHLPENWGGGGNLATKLPMHRAALTTVDSVMLLCIYWMY